MGKCRKKTCLNPWQFKPSVTISRELVSFVFDGNDDCCCLLQFRLGSALVFTHMWHWCELMLCMCEVVVCVSGFSGQTH